MWGIRIYGRAYIRHMRRPELAWSRKKGRVWWWCPLAAKPASLPLSSFSPLPKFSPYPQGMGEEILPDFIERIMPVWEMWVRLATFPSIFTWMRVAECSARCKWVQLCRPDRRSRKGPGRSNGWAWWGRQSLKKRFEFDVRLGIWIPKKCFENILSDCCLDVSLQINFKALLR